MKIAAQPDQQTTGTVSPRRADWLKWLAVVVVLLTTHLATAWHYGDRYAQGIPGTFLGANSLDLTFDEWSSRAPGADSTFYLEVARNLADGKGVVWQLPNSDPPRSEAFRFWGPGAPVVLGAWLKVTGGRTMFTFFVFSVLCQLFFGAVAIATISLYTRWGPALMLTAFFSGYCPPMQDRLFGVHLTSSETVSLIPLSLLFFALAKAFIAYRDVPASSWRTWFSQGPWGGAAVRRTLIWFALSGALLGCYSLIREPGWTFAMFVGGFVVIRAGWGDRGRLMPAFAAAMLLIAGAYFVRFPVQLWNEARCGESGISVASDGCIWRYGLWAKHDKFSWYDSAGIGFGEYLDPEAAHRVEDHFQRGKIQSIPYSLYELAQAIVHRPADALTFKTARLPVLWLDTDMWPRFAWRWETKWCVIGYSLLVGFAAVRLWRRQIIPEPLYLYILLLCCATPFIHFEFRYTLPAWQTLVLVPGLFATALRRGGCGRLSIDGGDNVKRISYPIGKERVAPYRRRLAA